MNNPIPNNIRAKNRRSLIILILVFCMPMIIAWFVLKNIDTLKPSKTRNKGELVQPAKPLADFELVQMDKKKFTLTELRGKWSVIYFAPADCEQVCQETISKIHQARLGQGKEMHRVRNVYINTSNEELNQQTQDFIKPLNDLNVLAGDKNTIDSFVAQFTATGFSTTESGRIFLVDPIGNIMMTYKNTFVVIDLLKDLEHLLKYSQIG